jgi:uncharacterized protein (TIRG00374 family)
VTERASSEKKPARWKSVARLLFAVLLLGVVLEFFVSWRDRVTWPGRYGAAPLVGSLEVGLDHPRFRCDRGDRSGTTLEFIPSSGARVGLWEAVVETRPDGKQERIALDDAQRKELEKQPEEGLITTFARLLRKPEALAIAILLYVVAGMISFQRWHVLLRAAHVDAKFWRAQKLAFIGLFFNNIIPGMTGGDLVKAIMVARDHPEQRPTAVLSVIIDRIIGLLGLVLVAVGALLFQTGPQYEEMAKKLHWILLAIAVGGVVMLSKKLRRLLLIDRLMNALPFAETLHKLDRAAMLYRSARWQLAYAVAVSLVVHGMILTAIGVLGRAIGITIPFLDFYTLAPLALIAASLPLSPGGIGVGEMAFVFLFAKANVPGAQALALSFSYRAVMMSVSLIGGLLMAVQHEPPVSKQEYAEEAEEEEKLGEDDDPAPRT